MTALFLTATATTEIYTLSLHDALPILVIIAEDSRFRSHVGIDPAEVADALGVDGAHGFWSAIRAAWRHRDRLRGASTDRKSTRLNSSHLGISYAVFCLKKKKTIRRRHQQIFVMREFSAPLWPMPLREGFCSCSFGTNRPIPCQQYFLHTSVAHRRTVYR